jgi:hypothetical protein
MKMFISYADAKRHDFYNQMAARGGLHFIFLSPLWIWCNEVLDYQPFISLRVGIDSGLDVEFQTDEDALLFRMKWL